MGKCAFVARLVVAIIVMAFVTASLTFAVARQGQEYETINGEAQGRYAAAGKITLKRRPTERMATVINTGQSERPRRGKCKKAPEGLKPCR